MKRLAQAAAARGSERWACPLEAWRLAPVFTLCKCNKGRARNEVVQGFGRACPGHHQEKGRGSACFAQRALWARGSSALTSAETVGRRQGARIMDRGSAL